MSFFRKRYKLRLCSPTGGHQISLPPAWVQGKEHLDKVEILYNTDICVIIPPGIRVNEKVLEGAFEQAK